MCLLQCSPCSTVVIVVFSVAVVVTIDYDLRVPSFMRDLHQPDEDDGYSVFG